VSEADYQRLMAKARADIDADPRCARIRAALPQVYEVGAAGIWLQDRAADEGADEQAVQGLASAHGQACFPRRDPWATAQALLQRWRDGRAPEPGAAFGDELLEGDVSDLPKGGFRIVRATT
jgi:hypothetical protein